MAQRLPGTDSLVGQVFGRLTILGDGPKVPLKHGPRSTLLAACACGAERAFLKSNILSGASASCGCLQRDVAGKILKAQRVSQFKHGMSRSPEHRSWAKMVERCTNSACKAFPRYGGRGITVCERWCDFKNFIADMGAAPPGTSIDRIDNDRGYEPGNCRWATRTEQANNKRNNRWVEAFGRRMTIAQWSRHAGIAPSTLRRRLNRGEPPERIIKEHQE